MAAFESFGLMWDPPDSEVVNRDLASTQHRHQQRSGWLLEEENRGTAGQHRSKALHCNEEHSFPNPVPRFSSLICNRKQITVPISPLHHVCSPERSIASGWVPTGPFGVHCQGSPIRRHFLMVMWLPAATVSVPDNLEQVKKGV